MAGSPLAVWERSGGLEEEKLADVDDRILALSFFFFFLKDKMRTFEDSYPKKDIIKLYSGAYDCFKSSNVSLCFV